MDKDEVILNIMVGWEQTGQAFSRNAADDALLQDMIKEINTEKGLELHYLAELYKYTIPGVGEIVAKYIEAFQDENLKADLVHLMVDDRIEGCAEILLRMFQHFRETDEYIEKVGQPTPAHIYITFDNAFRRLKPRKLKWDLFELVKNPRDAYCMTFTTKMVASWKIPAMEELLYKYLYGEGITIESLGICPEAPNALARLEDGKEQLMFTALQGLKYYPTQKNLKLLKSYAESDDKNIRRVATKSVEGIEKALSKKGS